MSLQLGDTVPNFTQASSAGEIDFYEWAGDSWVVLFSHPADFTPVCTTELGEVAELKPEVERRIKFMTNLELPKPQKIMEAIPANEHCGNLASPQMLTSHTQH